MNGSPADRWENPLTTRYASAEMSSLFSARSKFTAWRRLWLWLAEAEKQLGLPIPEASLEALRAHLVPTDAELDAADRYERETKHDVMAHLHALGDVAPAAKGVLHLGATSAFVGDNADLLLLREALRLLATRTVRVMGRLARFARAYRDLPCLGFTHFQAAQPTTVGKRACLWLQDLALDHRELVRRADELRFLGCKGATGHPGLLRRALRRRRRQGREPRQARRGEGGLPGPPPDLGPDVHAQAGRARPLGALGPRGVRLEVRERHPAAAAPQGGRGAVREEAGRLVRDAVQAQPDEVRADERALARWLLSISDNGNWTHATQWFERTLDDSANRRLALAEAFLSADSILLLWDSVADGLVVHPSVVRRRLDVEIPFLATENILMAAAIKGGDRQALHEKIRVLAQAAGDRMKNEGGDNDLLFRIAADSSFGLTPGRDPGGGRSRPLHRARAGAGGRVPRRRDRAHPRNGPRRRVRRDARGSPGLRKDKREKRREDFL